MINIFVRLDLLSTEEGPESEDNTYLGYSLALGHFDGEEGDGDVQRGDNDDDDDDVEHEDCDGDDDDDVQHADNGEDAKDRIGRDIQIVPPGDSYPDIAIGMPRGANLTGKVAIIIVTRTSSQLLSSLSFIIVVFVTTTVMIITCIFYVGELPHRLHHHHYHQHNHHYRRYDHLKNHCHLNCR